MTDMEYIQLALAVNHVVCWVANPVSMIVIPGSKFSQAAKGVSKRNPFWPFNDLAKFSVNVVNERSHLRFS